MATKKAKLLNYEQVSANLNLLIAENGLTKHEFGLKLGVYAWPTITKRFQGYGWKMEEMVMASEIFEKKVEDIFFKRISTNVEI